MQSNYKHLLLAMDLYPEHDKNLFEHTLALAKLYQAKITILYIAEHLNVYGLAQAYPSVLEIQDKLAADAKTTLETLKKTYQIETAETVVLSGSPKILILDYAKQHGVDLIVLGSHGRHGLQLLLGSTANAVLHNAGCDVLAVRLKSKT